MKRIGFNNMTLYVCTECDFETTRKMFLTRHVCDPEMKGIKSFFDYSDKEKEEIIMKAAVESNKAQQKLMDTPKKELLEKEICSNCGGTGYNWERDRNKESMLHKSVEDKSDTVSEVAKPVRK